jgi:hypothetical protein
MTHPLIPLREIISEADTAAIGAYVAVETWRQGDGSHDVGFLMHAWVSAIVDKEHDEPLSLPMIIGWAKMIDPSANKGTQTFRTGSIYIGWEERPAINLDRQMENWLAAVNEGYYESADYAYKAFEEIHPFWDGNGRTGKIIFNWLNDTLRKPTWPINFWGISNP